LASTEEAVAPSQGGGAFKRDSTRKRLADNQEKTATMQSGVRGQATR